MHLPVELPQIDWLVSALRPWWLLAVTPCPMAAAPAHSPCSYLAGCHRPGCPSSHLGADRSCPWTVLAPPGPVTPSCSRPSDRLSAEARPSPVSRSQVFPCGISTVEGQRSGSPALGLAGHRLQVSHRLSHVMPAHHGAPPPPRFTAQGHPRKSLWVVCTQMVPASGCDCSVCSWSSSRLVYLAILMPPAMAF